MYKEKSKHELLKSLSILYDKLASHEMLLNSYDAEVKQAAIDYERQLRSLKIADDFHKKEVPALNEHINEIMIALSKRS